jgi:hypothetical protein
MALEADLRAHRVRDGSLSRRQTAEIQPLQTRRGQSIVAKLAEAGGPLLSEPNLIAEPVPARNIRGFEAIGCRVANAAARSTRGQTSTRKQFQSKFEKLITKITANAKLIKLA